VILNRN